MPVSPPIMPGWDGYPVRDALSREFGAPVLLDNDVNIMALGEQHDGVARSASDFLFVKIGTGIGCGIVVERQLYRGADGCAGDIGHIRLDQNGPVCACGNLGCLEAFFGGAALARDAAAAARSGRSDVLAAAAGGARRAHAPSTSAWPSPRATRSRCSSPATAAAGSGSVLASLVSFFNPGLIVIGGGVAGLGHALLAEIRSVIYRQSLPLATGNLPVVLSELGGDAGVIGAARLISDAVYAAG